MSNFDVLLIEEVKKYQNLYDPSHKDYKDIARSYADWEAITIALRLPGEVSYVKAKWRSLRDGYARARRKSLYGHWVGKVPHYKFFKELDFLTNFIKHKDEDGKLPPHTAASKRKKMKPVEEAQDSDTFVGGEFCPSEGLWVPDVILEEGEREAPPEEEEIPSSLKTPSSASKNNPSSSYKILQQQEQTDEMIADPEKLYAEGGARSVARSEETAVGVVGDLKTLLWGSQKHLDEDEVFGLFVATSLRKYSKTLKSEAKLKIQQILYEIDLKDLPSGDG